MIKSGFLAVWLLLQAENILGMKKDFPSVPNEKVHLHLHRLFESLYQQEISPASEYYHYFYLSLVVPLA